MALNLSRKGLFSEINKFSNEYLMEGFPDKKNSAGFGNCLNFNFNEESENSQDGCITEKSIEKVSDDIIDLLPSDPFGMDSSSTVTAITGWIEDFELNSLGFGTDQVVVERGEDRLFAGLNLVCNGAVKFHPEVGNSKIQEAFIGSDEELCDGGLVFDGDIEEFVDVCYEKYWVRGNTVNEFQECAEIQTDADGDAPHDGLLFALGYLGVRDLLSIERVCKSLRDAVQNDPLLWRNIHIAQPLNHRITDDALLWLTNRAQATLQCLVLDKCYKITDSGLKHVLESNPGLTKLSIPECVRLSVEGILCNLKAFKSAGKLGIKYLRIGGLYDVTNNQFEELKFLLGADNHKQVSANKPWFYSGWQFSCDDDRAIDIEACPRCQKLRQVYDCPAESCQGKHQSTQLCRACTLCITRCYHCGRCINGCDYEETFYLDLLCLDCWKQCLNCPDKQNYMGIHSSKCTIFHQQARYHLCLYAFMPRRNRCCINAFGSGDYEA